MLLLPLEQAKNAMKAAAHRTTSIILHAPDDYQRPPDVVAPWIATFPVELWKDDIGGVLLDWMRDDSAAATGWLSQLPLNVRDAALADYCRWGGSESDERAITLGLTISDRKLRDQALGELARRLG